MRLQYEIAATGVNQLKRVLRSVEQEQRASNMRAANASAKMWARQLAAVKREVARVEARGIRTRTGPTTRGAAGTMAASRAAERAAIGSARRRSMVELSEAERLHRHRLEQMASEGSARIAGIKSAAREERRIENLRHRLRLRNVEREKAREVSALTRARVAKERSAAGRGTAMGGAITRSVGGAVAGIGRAAVGLGALGGGFAAFGAVRNQMEVEAAASTLANKALGTPGEKRDREQIRADVIKQSRDLGAKTGLGAQGIIGALSSFTAISGNLGLGQQLAPYLADITDATGASVEDVGRTAGQIVQNIMARPGTTEAEAFEQTRKVLGAMAGQAKVGSIEFADLARNMGAVMSATNGFEGDVGELAKTLAATAQLAVAGGAKSPEEAMTAIMRFRDDIIQNEGRFRKMQLSQGNVHGVNYFTDESATELRNPMEILADVMRVTKGSMPKIQKLFGIRAKKAVEPYAQAFVKGGGLKDPEKGLKAMNAVFERIMKADMSAEETTRSAAFRRRDADKQLAISVEKFNAEVGSKLLPVLTQLIPKFTDMIPKIGQATSAFANVASWAVENPLQGIGALLLAKVTADIAGAQLGSVVSKGIGSLLQRSPMGGIAIGTAAFAVTAGTIAIDQVTKAKDAGRNRAAVNVAQSGADVANAQLAIQQAGGIQNLTPEQRTTILEKAHATIAAAQRTDEIAKQGLLETIGNTITGQGAGITTVLQAREEGMAGKPAVKEAEAMIVLLEQSKLMSEMLGKAAAVSEKASAVMQRAGDTMATAADKMNTAADNPPPPTPDSPRRNSPVLNR